MALQQSTTSELWEINVLKYLKTVLEGRETTMQSDYLYPAHTVFPFEQFSS